MSSLAFAVGIYIPMQYSTPIFLGGLVRWAVDRWTARRDRRGGRPRPLTAEARAARPKSRPSPRRRPVPACCSASGYIAGGSLAGVTHRLPSSSARYAARTALDFARADSRSDAVRPTATRPSTPTAGRSTLAAG